MPNHLKPFGYTIFCDDIRQEAGNKISLMGLYKAELFVPQFPFIMPKFCLSIHYIEPAELPRLPIRLRVLAPESDDEVVLFEFSPPIDQMLPQALPAGVPPEDAMRLLEFPLQFAPFQFNQEGRLKVRVIRGGDEVIKLGSLSIRLADGAPEQGAAQKKAKD